MMKKLLPPQTEGEYYVSFNGLDKEMKRKAYKPPELVRGEGQTDSSLGLQQYQPQI
jgi:hypothetical protein